ncbi:MAG: class I SAM-dependent methyltransferase [Nanoarchaeota archaeon]
MKCRMCEGDSLEQFLDLGFTPLADSFLKEEDLLRPETYYPLNVYVCHACGFMQLGYVVQAEILYCRDYPYESSITLTFREHFFDMSKIISKRFNLLPESLVIDIGSNVGLLLLGFKAQGMRVLGVDPAINIAKKAIENGIENIPLFFSSKLASKIAKEKGKASVVTATNVFAHIMDLDDFMRGIDLLLEERGIFVFEVPYALVLIKQMLYDTIYHEHLGYMSIKPLVTFFHKFGMELFDIEMVKTHGGSIRCFVGRKGKKDISPSIKEFIDNENIMQIYSIEHLRKFAGDVKKHRQALVSLLRDLKKQGKRIVGVGAPAKGNTLLNYCKIDTEILDYITEKSKLKIGLYAPGTHIPIYPDQKLIEDKPDYALLLSWNFADEIMKNLKDYTKHGGKFIIPFPKPRIVD